MRLHRNNLNGTLPSEIGLATNLRSFLVSSNQITGTLPPEYGQWTSMEDFDVSLNDMSGTIPSTYATNWENYDESWFIKFQATESPSSATSPQPPSPSPTVTSAPTMQNPPLCDYKADVNLVCPTFECTLESPICRKQPFLMEFRVDARPCEQSIIRDCPGFDKDSCSCIRNVTMSANDPSFPEFNCEDFDGGPQANTLMYFVPSDLQETFIYSEGTVSSTGGRFVVVDPDSIKIGATLKLSIYEFDETTSTAGNVVQQVSIDTRCEDESDLNLLDIFGSFQLISFESNVQEVGFGMGVDVQFLLDASVVANVGSQLEYVSATVLSFVEGLIPPQVLGFFNATAGDGPLNPSHSFDGQVELTVIPDQDFEVLLTVEFMDRGEGCLDLSSTVVSCSYL